MPHSWLPNQRHRPLTQRNRVWLVLALVLVLVLALGLVLALALVLVLALALALALGLAQVLAPAPGREWAWQLVLAPWGQEHAQEVKLGSKNAPPHRRPRRLRCAVMVRQVRNCRLCHRRRYRRALALKVV